MIFLVALATALLSSFYVGKRRQPQASTASDRDEPLALLFEDGVLHHANAPAMSRLALMPGAHFWEDLRDSLVERFPDFPNSPGMGDQGSLSLKARDEKAPQILEMRWRGPLCWVTLASVPSDHVLTRSGVDAKEVEAFRRSVDTTPHPIWHQDEHGKIIWFNHAYKQMFELIKKYPPHPDETIFPDPKNGAKNRVSVHTGQDSKADWFDLVSLNSDGITVNHATSINALVKAEDAQRNFVQTLAKTFAHLSIGLAIFDRNGQLALFNPALLDLTGLPAEFLSGQPKMLSFFDQLRENRRMPEPKNYRNWRQEISDVISAATDGTYRETWSLEDGRTYSVQGRPHPDGATAFLIEDISAEVSLTRNFRSELELGQALLDKVDDGLVVFSASGVLTFCNAVYKNLWQQNPDAAFADVTISDCVKIWKQQTNLDVPWQQFLSGLASIGLDQKTKATLTFDQGNKMLCTAERIASGATLIRFTYLHEAPVPVG